ncbi:alginate lyase family protein [Bradyrhizobium sp. PMVTL-01]|uniref:heparinase II/III family protein n=1 Tax=Bradyrhizobium sp. PMVTL-01 TaxID=3434999 RepID=UPI003F71DA3E
MDPDEIGARVRDWGAQEYWRYRFYARGTAPQPNTVADKLQFRGRLNHSIALGAPEAPRDALIKSSDALLEGRWPTFSLERKDVTPNVDWHLDPKSQVTLPRNAYAFDIRIHGEGVGFETKYVWELSRHHHTTMLAMAYWLTGSVPYAEAAASQIGSWRAANSFLNGVHWSSGIELGMRLIAFVWTRRLLADWKYVKCKFENNKAFVECVYQHQWLLIRRMSLGSSANNHLIYEATGLYLAACSMPWFSESADWRTKARIILQREFRNQTFESGINRELGSGYNAYVLEALVLCLIEGQLSDDPWPPAAWTLAADILFRLADFTDHRGRPPRQGDSDDAQGLLLDAPGFSQWIDLLQLGAAWFGRADWWPRLNDQPLRSWLWGRIATPPGGLTRQLHQSRNSLAPDAGLVVLRSESNTPNEIYCVFDAGPLGYLSIAAHGHADALAIELRCGGQSILVDPGTFSYNASRAWRKYFRSTAAHNTLEVCGVDQSESGGPFLWTRAAQALLLEASGLEEGLPVATAEGKHDGYQRRFGVTHSRRVELNRGRRELNIDDQISGADGVPVRLMFHLHPAIGCALTGNTVQLSWSGENGRSQAEILLPELMNWRAVSGTKDPLLGWYSPSYDVVVPTITLVGDARVGNSCNLRTTIRFGWTAIGDREGLVDDC